MAIDPSILLKGQGADPGRFANAMNAGMVMQTNRLALDAARQQQAEQNKLREMLAGGFDLNAPEAPVELLKHGKAGAEMSGKVTEMRKAKLEQAKTTLQAMKDAATFGMANPQFGRQAIIRFGQLTGNDVTQELAQYDSLGNDPEAIRQYFAGHALQADKLIPQIESFDLGGTRERQVVDPVSGKVTSSTSRAKTMAPGDAERLALERRRVAVSERADAPGTVAPSLTEIVDPTDPKHMLRIDAKVYRGGGVGSPGVIGRSGKEPISAGKELQTEEGKASVDAQVANLRDLYNQLQERRGITDTEKGPLSNLTAGIASTGVGQAAGRMVGTKNQSLRNQIAQSRPLLLQAIKNATGMTAKQMDSNVELKMYLAAATDPTLDVQANLAALDNLSRLFGLGGDNASPSPAAASGVKFLGFE